MKVTVAKTDVRFRENLQRFALCCTLRCTDVALRCTETPQFLLHRCPMQGLVPPDHCARNPVQRKAPGGHLSIGRRPLRLHFWVWKHYMVLVPRGGSSLVLHLDKNGRVAPAAPEALGATLDQTD